MAFNNFFRTLSQTAVDADYRGIFATSASTITLSANLSSLSAEGADIVRWVRYRMGEPKIVCELENSQIFATFEESCIEYGATINKSCGVTGLLTPLISVFLACIKSFINSFMAKISSSLDCSLPK